MVETRPVNIDLSIEVNGDDVIANVLFSNTSSEKVYLDAWTICTDDKFRRNIFSIIDENDRHVPYSGMMINRSIDPEDFIALNPGESTKTKITVNRAYKLIKGHKYSIKFCVYNPTLPNMQSRIELLSNKVEITY